jgi:aminoglycoside 6'-N-acetyltransferase I
MEFTVREMRASDRLAWTEMRTSLWPDSASIHAEEIEGILDSDDSWGFIAEARDGAPIGFAELSIRKYANGCMSRPVPFLEGIWVRVELRRQGIGLRLIEAVEQFLAELGFRELGSDSEAANLPAHAAHRGWGFAETERVVYFRKVIRPLVR